MSIADTVLIHVKSGRSEWRPMRLDQDYLIAIYSFRPVTPCTSTVC